MLGDRLSQITVNVHGTMKYAKNLDSIIVNDEIRNPVVTVQYFTDFSISDRCVSLTDPRMFAKPLDFVIDTSDNIDAAIAESSAM